MKKHAAFFVCLFLFVPCLTQAIMRELVKTVRPPTLRSQRMFVRTISVVSNQKPQAINDRLKWLTYKIMHIEASLDNGCTPWLSFELKEPGHVRKELGLLKSECEKLKLILHQDEKRPTRVE